MPKKKTVKFDVFTPTGEYIRTFEDKEIAEGFASKVVGRTVVKNNEKGEEEEEEIEE